MSTKIDKTKAVDAVPEQRNATVDPKRVTIADANQCWRSVFVRMPKDSISDDLRNPAIWKLVQQSNEVSLAKLDHLLICGFDESWMARAIVTAVSHTDAQLVIEKVSGFREQATSEFENEQFRVEWAGNGYAIQRKPDNVHMDGVVFQTVPQAVTYIHTHLMPRKVA